MKNTNQSSRTREECAQRSRGAVIHWIAIINALGGRYGYRVIDEPDVAFDLGGSDAGQAVRRNGRWTLRLNPLLLTHFSDRFEQEFIPHELAHIASDEWLGSEEDDHGYRWRWIMREIGVPARECHDLLQQLVAKGLAAEVNRLTTSVA